jgi:hypothetical protein
MRDLRARVEELNCVKKKIEKRLSRARMAARVTGHGHLHAGEGYFYHWGKVKRMNRMVHELNPKLKNINIALDILNDQLATIQSHVEEVIIADAELDEAKHVSAERRRGLDDALDLIDKDPTACPDGPAWRIDSDSDSDLDSSDSDSSDSDSSDSDSSEPDFHQEVRDILLGKEKLPEAPSDSDFLPFERNEFA